MIHQRVLLSLCAIATIGLGACIFSDSDEAPTRNEDWLPGIPAAIAVSPDGERVAVLARDSTLSVWAISTGEKVYTVEIGSMQHEIRYVADGSEIELGLTGHVDYYRAFDGALLRSMPVPSVDGFAIQAYDPARGVSLAVRRAPRCFEGFPIASDDHQLRIIRRDGLMGEETQTGFDVNPCIPRAILSPNRGFVAARRDDSLAVWKTDEAQRVLRAYAGGDRICCNVFVSSAFSGDDSRIFTLDLGFGEDTWLRWWDASTGWMADSMAIGPPSIDALVADRTGGRVAVAGYLGVSVYDIPTRSLVRRIEYDDPDLAYGPRVLTPDGKRLLGLVRTRYLDGNVRRVRLELAVWDLAD